MHLLLGLLTAAVLGYLFYKIVVMGSKPASPAAAGGSDRPFAFIANGLIFYRERGSEVKQLHSAYVQEVQDRQERSRQRHGWKEGTTFGIRANYAQGKG